MAAVTIAPSDEACQALVARINSGTNYQLPVPCDYRVDAIDELEQIADLRVTVVHMWESDTDDQLDIENRTSHHIRVWVRDKLPDNSQEQVAARNLIFRQIWQRVNNFDSSNKRVRVWECGKGTMGPSGEVPGKMVWVEQGFYRAYVALRVEVEAPV